MFLHVGLPEKIKGPLACTGLSAKRVSNTNTLEEMKRVHDETGWLICPHTAVGTSVARSLPESDAMTVVLATAHAAKFPETVEKATGLTPDLPHRVQDVIARDEEFDRVANDLAVVRTFIRDHQRL